MKIKNIIKTIIENLTITRGTANISKTREVLTPPIREAANAKPVIDSFSCPYCFSKNFQKRGLRAKKHEKVQLYLCKSCGKTFTPLDLKAPTFKTTSFVPKGGDLTGFTPQITKGKHYPLTVMLDALSTYNLGYSLEETCRIVNQKITTKKSAFADLVRLTDLRKDWPKNLENNISSKSNLVNRGVDLPGIGPGRLGFLDQSSKPAKPTPESVSHVGLQSSTLSNWIAEFKDNLPYLRLREFALKRYSPKDTVVTATLAHRQLYRYRFHRAKCDLMIQEDIQHRKFRPMQDFLDLVPSETPHQYFSEGERASETPLTFSKTAMIVRGKTNFATKTATFVLQSVKDRRLRHEALQKFMLYNDSVTVATEVPVYIMRDDIEHMKTQLGFEIYSRVIARSDTTKQSINEIAAVAALPRNDHARPAAEVSRDLSAKSLPTCPPKLKERRREAEATTAEVDVAEIVKLPKLITGHIDILQIRNGMIHILDYKPKAEKERPIEQLTLYAMALSRLTGLRLFEFKCAWFDEKDYFEFYPLHVLHKPRRAQRRRKVNTQEGTYLVNRNERKVERIRPELI